MTGEENNKVSIILDADEETGVATLLQGAAPEQKPLFRKGTTVSGTLSVPANHLDKPSKKLTDVEDEFGDTPIKHSYVEINREQGTIEFIEDKGFPWESNYKGSLEFDERFLRFNINTGKLFAPLELGQFFKMNRSLFESVAQGSKISSTLMNFEADIDKKVKEADDGRANTNSIRSQAVRSNVPPTFRLNVPIFKGCGKQIVEVEIGIDARSLNCTLISPEANDYIEAIKDEKIDEQIKRIVNSQPDLRIFEI